MLFSLFACLLISYASGEDFSNFEADSSENKPIVQIQNGLDQERNFISSDEAESSNEGFQEVTYAEPPTENNRTKQNNLIVQTKNGLVQGRNFTTIDDAKFPYVGFQGIPYAEPPTGNNRFREPIPSRSWTGILDAGNEAPMCMQPLENNNSNLNMSEDCLYLNVYTPDIEGAYPVMVWIYGGFFLLGSSAKRLYGPDYLIQENVVIVTLNYRVGIFGFLSTQDEVLPGNYGLKDQILALKWVKENIGAFGGDPNNVIIFGESAGSAAVSLLLQAEQTEGLFHGAIMESGVSLSLFSRTRDPADMAYSIAGALEIEANSSEELVDKLRKVEAKSLLTTSLQTDIVNSALGNPLHGLLFAPSIEPEIEGAVFTKNVYEMLERGEFRNVPIIVGFNSAEGNPFEVVISTLPAFLLKYEVDYTMLVPADMNVNTSDLRKVGREIKNFYFGYSLSFRSSPLSKFISDDQFVRPTNEFVRLVSEYVPVYYYEFSYVGNVSGASRKLPGVGHGEDVSYLWNTGIRIDADDEPTRKKLVKLWTNFAKYKNPTPEVDKDLDDVIWEPSNSDDLTYLDIDSTLKMHHHPHKNEINLWTHLYDTYGNPPYDTY